MISPVINSIYISASCNPFPNCCDLNKNDVLCYGSCHSVVLHRILNKDDIKKTLLGHSDQVNCVKWIEVAGSEPYIVSCSSDKSIVLWKPTEKYNYEDCLKAVCHDGSITYMDGMHASNGIIYIATTSADCTTKLWKTNINTKDPGIELLTELKLKNQIVLSLSLYKLPITSEVILACGVEDQKIHLFIEKDNEFEEIMSLRGHTEWIRGLEFIQHGNDEMLLASASQDSYVRIWRISKKDGGMSSDDDQGDMEEYNKISAAICDEDDDEDDGGSISLTSNIFSSGSHNLKFTVTLESVLSGHDNWVYSVHWSLSGQNNDGLLRLISSSMDKTIIVWKVDASTGLWMEETRLGEVGGSNLGFYGGLMTHNGGHILGYNFRGAFHLWSPSQTTTTMMEPSLISSGHFSPVNDLCWNQYGEFLLTVSNDQTTRLHAKWDDQTWCELARPQVHGYDIKCISSICRFQFASGADEKIVRTFSAPTNFLHNFSHLCGVHVSEEELHNSHTEGACVPALGLSNKPVSEQQQHPQKQQQQYLENYFVPQIYKRPPTEDNLMQNTLWPEDHKLYGHGYELFALDCSPDGRVIASACKATKLEHASIMIWEVNTWQHICTLQHHTLTVTQLNFNHHGNLLLSVSRDRTWAVYRRHQDGLMFSKVCYSTKDTCLHSRIIWSSAWSHDDHYFATGSRDKKVIIWKVDECVAVSTNTTIDTTNNNNCIITNNTGNNTSTINTNNTDIPSMYNCTSSSILDLNDSVTAIDFAPHFINHKFLTSIGLDGGNILFYLWSSGCHGDASPWICIQSLNNSIAHHKTVKRLRFRPTTSSSSSSSSSSLSSFEIASCSEDCSVKIFEIKFT